MLSEVLLCRLVHSVCAASCGQIHMSALQHQWLTLSFAVTFFFSPPLGSTDRLHTNTTTNLLCKIKRLIIIIFFHTLLSITSIPIYYKTASSLKQKWNNYRYYVLLKICYIDVCYYKQDLHGYFCLCSASNLLASSKYVFFSLGGIFLHSCPSLVLIVLLPIKCNS